MFASVSGVEAPAMSARQRTPIYRIAGVESAGPAPGCVSWTREESVTL